MRSMEAVERPFSGMRRGGEGTGESDLVEGGGVREEGVEDGVETAVVDVVFWVREGAMRYRSGRVWTRDRASGSRRWRAACSLLRRSRSLGVREKKGENDLGKWLRERGKIWSPSRTEGKKRIFR